MDDRMEYDLYVLAEINYKDLFKLQENIFPSDWYNSKDYKLKTEIIAQAIDNNILIVDTPLYKEKFVNKISHL